MSEFAQTVRDLSEEAKQEAQELGRRATRQGHGQENKQSAQKIMAAWRQGQVEEGKVLPSERLPFQPVIFRENYPNQHEQWRAEFCDAANPDIVKGVVHRIGKRWWNIAFNEPGGVLKVTDDGVKLDGTFVFFSDLFKPSDAATLAELKACHTDPKQPGLLKFASARPPLSSAELHSLSYPWFPSAWPSQHDPWKITDICVWGADKGFTLDLSELTKPDQMTRVSVLSGSPHTVWGEKTRGAYNYIRIPESPDQPHSLEIPANSAWFFKMDDDFNHRQTIWLSLKGNNPGDEPAFSNVYVMGDLAQGLYRQGLDSIRVIVSGKGKDGTSYRRAVDVTRPRLDEAEVPFPRAGAPIMSNTTRLSPRKPSSGTCCAIRSAGRNRTPAAANSG